MEDDFYGLYSAFFNSNSRPDLINDNYVHVGPVASQIDDEIATLEKVYGDMKGKTLEVELSKLLEILPRKRKRIDAYNKLVKKLKEEMGCDLVIKSRKTR